MCKSHCLAGCAVMFLFVAAIPSVSAAAKIHNVDHPAAVKGEYVVVLNDGAASAESVRAVAEDFVSNYAVSVLSYYSTALKGFAVTASPDSIHALAGDPRVRSVEANVRLRLVDKAKISPTYTQPTDSWALEVIDQRTNDFDGEYAARYNGSPVHAYIVDSGIIAELPEFGGRVSGGDDFVDDGFGTSDCDGHGTNVASLVGGDTFGVAMRVNLHPVRVLDCWGWGYLSKFIEGMDWLAANRVLPAVANMSLGEYLTSPAGSAAITAVIDSGVVVVAAAGNSNVDACGHFPSSVPGVYAVGAIDATWTKASFSDFGSCIDMHAPGVAVPVVDMEGERTTQDGTSMATAMVSGVMALYLTPYYFDHSPDAAMQFVSSTATRYQVAGIASTHSSNKIVYSLLDAPEDLDTGVSYMPTNVQVSNEQCRGLNIVTWDAPLSGATTGVEYDVYVSPYKDFRSEWLYSVADSTVAMVSVPFGGKYYVRIRARQQDNAESYPAPSETAATYFNGCL